MLAVAKDYQSIFHAAYVVFVTGRGSGFVAVEIPFTPRAKRVLELSLEEARQLGDLQPVLFILTPAYKFHQLCRFLLLPHLHSRVRTVPVCSALSTGRESYDLMNPARQGQAGSCVLHARCRPQLHWHRAHSARAAA